MKWFITVLALIISVAMVGCDEKKPEIKAHLYVSPEGSDTFSGKIAEVTENDGPFKTLQRAKEAVREFKKSTRDDIIVMLRGGDHYLNETLVLGLEDSGKKGQDIIYRNYPGEKPVITTGINITGWKKAGNLPAELPAAAKDKIWVADVPEDIGKLYVLFDGDTWLPRARSQGLFTTNQAKNGADAWRTENLPERNKIFFKKGDITNSERVQDIEILIIPSLVWAMNVLPIESIDEEKGLATTSIYATYKPGLNFMDKKSPNLWIENDFQYLDEPGEWVYDSFKNKLYHWPVGEKPSNDIFAPSLTELVRVEGDIEYDDSMDVPVNNIVFEGLTFARANRHTWKKDYIGWGLQHNWEMFDEPTSMLRFRGAKNCKVIDCDFENSGAAGVRFDLYAQGNEVSGCEFDDIGGGAILLSGYGPGTKDVNKNNKIVNNEIHDIGKIYWHSVAIWAWQSGENYIANNLIYDIPYSAIMVTGRIMFDKEGLGECSKTVRWNELEGDEYVTATYEGWKKMEKYLHARNNIVNRNEMYKICDVLGDGNAIYFSGAGTNNIASQNVIYNMTHLWGTSAIRPDADAYEQVFEQNLVYDCAIPALIVKHESNKYNNNIFVNCGTPNDVFYYRGAYIAMRCGPVTGSEIKNNIIYNYNTEIDAYEYGETYRKPTHLNQCDADYNVYYCPVEPIWEKETLAKHQEMGLEQNSIIADPMFVDAENKDFRLKPDSPVLKFPGYKQIPFDEIGLLKD